MTNKQCRGIYSQSNVTDHMLCAETNLGRGREGGGGGGEGGGGGGGGGRGLVVRPERTGLPYLQIGIESWGEVSGVPRVFTRLTSLMTWVYQVSPGFIITGGFSPEARNSVELFNPLTNKTCKLPNLTAGTFLHTDCSSMICRDGHCRKRTTLGSYSESTVRLLFKRVDHLCWPLPGEEGKVMLLGGSFSPNTTEIVSADGSFSTENWNLKYWTRLVARNVSNYHQLSSPPQSQLWCPGRGQVDSVWRSVCLYTATGQGREESVRLRQVWKT